MNWVPEGTEITISCRTALPPLEPPQINGHDETHVNRVNEGQYTILVLQWPTVLFVGHGHSALDVKPWSPFLAPGACFDANYDKGRVTYRLNTGPIRAVSIPGTKYFLTEEDGKKSRVVRAPRQPRRTGYTPLRKRS